MRRIINIFRNLISKVATKKAVDAQNHTIINVGILYICVGKYDMYFKLFYRSFEKYFLKGSNKIYFVFTDNIKLTNTYSKCANIHFIQTKKEGWPYDTLLRNRYFNEHFNKFQGMDYLIFCNANMICKREIYLDELGLGTYNKTFGVLQPYYFHKNAETFPVESQITCNAYFDKLDIPKIKHYFQGCFYGGNYLEFKHLVDTIYEWTEGDLNNTLIPIWHDESYLNRYFFEYPPFALHPGFAYPENVNLPFVRYNTMLVKSKLASHSNIRS